MTARSAEKYRPSVWDLLRKRVLALGWSDGFSSWASSVGSKCKKNKKKTATTFFFFHTHIHDFKWLSSQLSTHTDGKRPQAKTGVKLQSLKAEQLPRTIRELPVADVLQVGPCVLAHVLGGGDGTFVEFHLSPADLWTLSRRDAAGHGPSHR